MPFTPFHFGPSLVFGLPLRNHAHVPTFMVANVILDIEPFLVLVLGLWYPLHGYLHTFLVAFFVGIILGYTMFLLERFFRSFFKILLLEPKKDMSLKSFLVAGFSGTMFHVFLDSPLYGDILPFYPSVSNPLYNPALLPQIYNFCVWTGYIGTICYLCLVAFQIYQKLRKKQ